MSKPIKILLPVAVLALGLLAVFLLVRTRPEPQRQERPRVAPLVRVIPAEPRRLALDVSSRGTVMPRTEATLVAEVGGRIVAVAPSFTPGGFFSRGDVLVSIDRRDYELALEQARARVAQAEVRLELERAEAEVARREWQELGRGEPPPLAARKPQLAEASAALTAAEAAASAARLALERTRIVAPYAGRIREELADLGQFVAPGSPVARIYAIDYAEVRLPVRLDQLAFLDLPSLDGRAGRDGPRVELSAELAGQRRRWPARVVGTAGQIDPETRMLELVARIDDPFRGEAPLPVGLFVTAEIEGVSADGLVPLPRAALRRDDVVLVVGADERLEIRPVEVERRDGDTVIIASGLAAGERVVISPLEAPIDGMAVRIAEDGGLPPAAEIEQRAVETGEKAP